MTKQPLKIFLLVIALAAFADAAFAQPGGALRRLPGGGGYGGRGGGKSRRNRHRDCYSDGCCRPPRP